MEKLKLSSSKAQILIASHSMVSAKTSTNSVKTMIVSTKAMSALPKLDSLNSEIKIENTKESDIISPEKKIFIKIRLNTSQMWM